MLRKVQILLITVLSFSVLTASTAYAAEPVSTEDGEYTTLVFNGDPAVKVDVVFVGVNYGDSPDQLEKFISDTDRHINYLFAVQPFKSHMESINIYRVNTILDLRVMTRRNTMYVSPSNVSLRVNRMDIPNDVIIVLIKSSHWGGGSSYRPRVVCASSLYPWITLHEFGHAFGGLWDEYIYFNEDLTYDAFRELGPNVDWDGTKWEEIPGTGAFLGATYRNLYRSAQDCVMRTPDHIFFCPVCTAHLTSLFSDSDQDGIISFIEDDLGTDPLLTDTDSDNLPDYDEVVEYMTDPTTSDTDNDNLDDQAEIITYHTDPLIADTDDDRLSDYDEIVTYGTNPLETDTDDDGISDHKELVTYNTNPLVIDTDDDKLSDYDEIITYGTNPLETDTDDDRISDYDELIKHNTSPLIADTDDDKLSDYDEINVHGTSPLVTDTDDDKLSDYDEIITHDTDPLATDTDKDELSDYDEVIVRGTDPLVADTDGDLWKDSVDPMGQNLLIPNLPLALLVVFGLSCVIVWLIRRKKEKLQSL